MAPKLAAIPLVYFCFLIYTSNSQSQSPCFWSKCFLSGSSGSPCPSEYTNSTSKTCFWGTGTMYQCCKIVATTPSEYENSSSTEAVPETSQPSYTTDTTSVNEDETTMASSETGKPTSEIQDAATESPEPIHLLQCKEVKEKKYPFIVALLELREGKIIHFCSGAIVSEWHVLTSASCVADRLTATIDASAANLNLTYFEFTEQTITVRNIHLHGDFNPNDPTKKSDLALLEMEHPFRMWSDYVYPIRLAPDANFVDEPGNSGTVSGWEIEELEGHGSSALNEVDIPFVGRSECAELYRDFVEPLGEDKLDIQKQFCAASSQTHTGCIEDYGSPVTTRISNGTRYLVGISALHSNSTQVPNAYTDVTHFREFIFSIILSKK